MFDSILRFARQIVSGVMSQMMGQFNIVQDQALSPMRSMAQQVTGGVWIGRGADAFVQEVSTIMVPKTNQIMQQITKTHQDLQRAVDIIDRADQQVQQKVQGLDDIFQNIFSA